MIQNKIVKNQEIFCWILRFCCWPVEICWRWRYCFDFVTLLHEGYLDLIHNAIYVVLNVCCLRKFCFKLATCKKNCENYDNYLRRISIIYVHRIFYVVLRRITYVRRLRCVVSVRPRLARAAASVVERACGVALRGRSALPRHPLHVSAEWGRPPRRVHAQHHRPRLDRPQGRLFHLCSTP